MRLMMRDTVCGVVLGALIGALVALIAARHLAPYLLRVPPTDPAVFAGVLASLALIAGMASALPARRAGRSDPAIVLRGE